MLVEGPVALHDVAGVDVTAAEMILHRITVVTKLHHLTLEVGALVDAYAVGALAGLKRDGQGKYKIRTGNAWSSSTPFVTGVSIMRMLISYDIILHFFAQHLFLNVEFQVC